MFDVGSHDGGACHGVLGRHVWVFNSHAYIPRIGMQCYMHKSVPMSPRKSPKKDRFCGQQTSRSCLRELVKANQLNDLPNEVQAVVGTCSKPLFNEEQTVNKTCSKIENHHQPMHL